MNRLLLMCAVLAVSVGCGQRKAEESNPLPFPHVRVPAMYSGDPEAAAGYAAMHFWDGLADTSRHFPSDSMLVSGVRISDVEQGFADYAGLLSAVPYSTAEDAVCRMYDNIVMCERSDSSSCVFETLVALSRKYLYDPNSPLRNEDIYLPLARKLSGYEGFTAAERDAYAFDARMCSLNMVGTVAADFAFCDRYGKVRTLHGISAEWTLLFFSNPGCEACMSIINVLNSSEAIGRMIADGRLAVLNIYIDEDMAGWYDYMPVYPEDWYNGYDHNLIIRGDSLYNVRAIPSLYILDRDKRVVMKDAPEDRVFAWLEQNA